MQQARRRRRRFQALGRGRAWSGVVPFVVITIRALGADMKPCAGEEAVHGEQRTATGVCAISVDQCGQGALIERSGAAICYQLVRTVAKERCWKEEVMGLPQAKLSVLCLLGVRECERLGDGT